MPELIISNVRENLCKFLIEMKILFFENKPKLRNSLSGLNNIFQHFLDLPKELSGTYYLSTINHVNIKSKVTKTTAIGYTTVSIRFLKRQSSISNFSLVFFSQNIFQYIKLVFFHITFKNAYYMHNSEAKIYS